MRSTAAFRAFVFGALALALGIGTTHATPLITATRRDVSDTFLDRWVVRLNAASSPPTVSQYVVFGKTAPLAYTFGTDIGTTIQSDESLLSVGSPWGYTEWNGSVIAPAQGTTYGASGSVDQGTFVPVGGGWESPATYAAVSVTAPASSFTVSLLGMRSSGADADMQITANGSPVSTYEGALGYMSFNPGDVFLFNFAVSEATAGDNLLFKFTNFDEGFGAYGGFSLFAAAVGLNMDSSTITDFASATPITLTAFGVPEIDPAGFGSIAALLTGALGLLERRRLKAQSA